MKVTTYEFEGERYLKVKELIEAVKALEDEGKTQTTLKSFKNFLIECLLLK